MSAPLELVDDVVEVEVRALKHAIEVLLMVRVPIELAGDRRPGGLRGPCEALAQSREQVALLDDRVAQRDVGDLDGRDRRRGGRVDRRRAGGRPGAGRLARGQRRGAGQGAKRGTVSPTPKPLVVVVHAEAAKKVCRTVKVS